MLNSIMLLHAYTQIDSTIQAKSKRKTTKNIKILIYFNNSLKIKQ